MTTERKAATNSTYKKLAVEKLFRHLDFRLAKWEKQKYKSLGNSYSKAYQWIRHIKANYPYLLCY